MVHYFGHLQIASQSRAHNNTKYLSIHYNTYKFLEIHLNQEILNTSVTINKLYVTKRY